MKTPIRAPVEVYVLCDFVVFHSTASAYEGLFRETTLPRGSGPPKVRWDGTGILPAPVNLIKSLRKVKTVELEL